MCTHALVMAYGGDSDGIYSNGVVAFLRRVIGVVWYVSSSYHE
jgi:hypothetical protein